MGTEQGTYHPPYEPARRATHRTDRGAFEPYGHDAQERDVAGLGDVLVALRRRAKTIIAITLAAGLGAAAFVLLATPRYASESQVLLENRDTVFTRTLAEREIPGAVIDEEAVRSQIQLVTSREVAREAIRRLDLVGNAEFDPLVGPMDPVTRIRTMLGIASGSFDGREEDRIFDTYYRALTVYAVPRSRVIAIEFRSADPELSARAANVISEIYLEQLEEAQSELARAASRWLGANIEDLRDRVSGAEAAVEQFRASSRLFISGDSASVSSQQLSDLNARLADARSSQADAEARARLISDMIAEGRAFEIPDVANNDLIGRLIEQRIALRSQIALELRTLLPGHPRILELRAQLADLDEEITASAERTVRILENDARIAASRVESLQAALDAQMSVVAQANESEVQLRALEREARAEREQLENYLTRYREAIARGSENASLPDARVVSRAVIPNNPVFPRKVPTVVLATLGGFFLAVGGVVVAELAFGGGSQPARSKGQARTLYRPEEDGIEHDGSAAAVRGGFVPETWHGAAAPAEPEAHPQPSTRPAAAHAESGRPEILEVDGATEAPVLRSDQIDHSEDAARAPLAERVRRLGEGLRGTFTGAGEPRRHEAAGQEPVGEEMHPAMPPADGNAGAAEPMTAFDDKHDGDHQAAAEDDDAVGPRYVADAETVEALEETTSASAEVEPEPLPQLQAEPVPRAHKPRIRTRAAMRSRHMDEPAEADAVSRNDAGEPQKAVPSDPLREAPALPPAADASSDSGYRMEQLIARLRESHAGEDGCRVVVTGLGSPAKLREFANALASAIGPEERGIVIAMQSEGKRGLFPGITDLVAENASFFDVIQRDPEAAFHRVGFGKGEEEVILGDLDSLEITLTAFQHSYDWVFLLVHDPGAEALFEGLAGHADSVVLASDRPAEDDALRRLYEQASLAGASSVLVAQVGAVAKVAAA